MNNPEKYIWFMNLYYINVQPCLLIKKTNFTFEDQNLFKSNFTLDLPRSITLSDQYQLFSLLQGH